MVGSSTEVLGRSETEVVTETKMVSPESLTSFVSSPVVGEPVSDKVVSSTEMLKSFVSKVYGTVTTVVTTSVSKV